MITMKRIAYSGIEGAFAHMVARNMFPDEMHVPFGSFAEAYYAVASGDCDYAVLPVENSYAGPVREVKELLAEGGLEVVREQSFPITQNLLGVRGSRISDIRKVISQHKALEQCDTYIRDRGYEVIEAENTAVAARQVARMQNMAVAAIASVETAAFYGLKVLDEQINERDDNATKFAVVAAKRTQEDQ